MSAHSLILNTPLCKHASHAPLSGITSCSSLKFARLLLSPACFSSSSFTLWLPVTKLTGITFLIKVHEQQLDLQNISYVLIFNVINVMAKQ